MGFTGFLCGQVAFDLFAQAKKEKLVHPKIIKKYERIFSKTTFETISGDKIRLKEIAAPIVMLNFWASWCTPCLEEFPSIVDLRQKFKKDEIFIIGVNSDEENHLKEIKKVSRKYKFNFPNVADPSGGILSEFDVTSIPLTIIFYQGKVLEVMKGPHDFSSVEIGNNFNKLIEKSRAVVRTN